MAKRCSPVPVTMGELKALKQAIAESPHWADVVEKMGGKRSLSTYASLAACHGLGKPWGMSYRKWTDEEIETVRRMWSSGERVEDISEAVDRSPGSIYELVKRHRGEPGFEKRRNGWNLKSAG